MTLLRGVFWDRTISKGIWPPPPPELTSPDHYLWGVIQGAVYKDSHQPLFELKKYNQAYSSD
jgi:hypothetical protein